jgi:hypothetical protein
MKKMTPEELEQFIHQNLRSLPPRRAPRSLEARVMSALEHRATVAWYHQSWAYWPAAVRAAFLAVATAVSGAALTAFSLLSTGVDTSALTTELASRFSGVLRLGSIVTGLSDFLSLVIRNTPPFWLYGGAAFVAAMYVTCFGLGAAAYRTLYRSN